MSTPANTYTLRAAEPRDVDALDAMIRELAAFENLTHAVRASPEALRRHLFGDRPVAEAWVAEARVAGGTGSTVEPVAFAIFFTTFSTFLSQPGLYLEDLFVRSEHRRHGIGESLIRCIARLAVQRGHGRFAWTVLDWNSDAIRFYETMGATVMSDWRTCRVSGESLARLGAEPASAPPSGPVNSTDGAT